LPSLGCRRAAAKTGPTQMWAAGGMMPKILGGAAASGSLAHGLTCEPSEPPAMLGRVPASF
jgi:hypothetical protein